jgi:hypothetical protein
LDKNAENNKEKEQNNKSKSEKASGSPNAD